MSAARSFDIESPANISKDSSKIRCELINNILSESSTLRYELIGTRFQHLAEKPSVNFKAQQQEKSNLDLMKELGLLGAIEENGITSENYKEFIKNSLKNDYGKET